MFLEENYSVNMYLLSIIMYNFLDVGVNKYLLDETGNPLLVLPCSISSTSATNDSNNSSKCLFKFSWSSPFKRWKNNSCHECFVKNNSHEKYFIWKETLFSRSSKCWHKIISSVRNYRETGTLSSLLLESMDLQHL